MNQYFHKYKGIIIQNDDPENMGRVKVFVPEISMTLYKQWNDTKDKDKKFTELGGNLDSSISPEILDRLKAALPWGSVKMPIFGMGTSTTFHNDKNFAEIADDADNSNQQNVVNKEPAASLPENNEFPKNLSTAMKTSDVAKVPPNSPSIINNYQNSSDAATSPSYLNNLSSPQTSNSASTAQTSTSQTNLDPNISNITIMFTPNARNATNYWRRFRTSATISEIGGTSITGQADATNQRSAIVDRFTEPAITNYSPPITYTPTGIIQPTTTPSLIESTDTLFASATNVRETRTTVSAGGNITATFVPNSRNEINRNYRRRFTTSASIVVYDDGVISIPDPQDPNINLLVYKDEIDNIIIGYNSDKKPVNLQSSQLGGLGTLLTEYSGPNSVGMVSSPVAPPATKKSKYNRGGGGAELFALSFSDMLPFGTLLNCLVGNTNPDSKQTINQKKQEDGKKITNGSDPHERVGLNQQTSADCKPPMRSPTQSNKAKGMISIPAVGAKVAVYFDNGDPQFPVVDGVFYTQEDFAGIHDMSSWVGTTS